MRIHWLQHVPFEGLGTISNWIQKNKFTATVTRFWQNESPPGADGIDFLILMGGPMSVYEEDKYSWLEEEKIFVKACIESNARVLGICLGAQLIAEVLGVQVYKNRHTEIGWLPVQLTAEGNREWPFLQPQMTVFQWHGDTFDLPDGCRHLVQSEACRHQAFIYRDRVLALQYHLESTPMNVKNMIMNCGADITSGPYIQSADTMLATDGHFEKNHDAMDKILSKLIGNPQI
ncbi:type 1 glutamine amidotransferase [candidate division KSB1 bacterium]|nr:type 1 glutamine amidotransferase [candidate division KSB1 bacterium]